MESTKFSRWLSVTVCFALVTSLASVRKSQTDVRVPNIFGSHMLLQQGQANPVPATPFRTDDWPGVTINVHQ